MTHTPGPWDYVLGFGCKEITGEYYSIADTVGLSNEDEDLANARLIATAPEMLEALKEFMHIHEDLQAVPIQEVNNTLIKAQNAIAKTESE